MTAEEPAADVVVSLPEDLRSALKEPAGPLFTEADVLLEESGTPLLTVGDVVTYHVIQAGRTPEVALVDEQTERTAVEEEIAATIATHDGFECELTASNPAATLTAALLDTLQVAIDRPDATLIAVDGEEDLATLPAVVVAPAGASVVYGQPGEGMVHVRVNAETRAEMRELLGRMDGDTSRLFSLLDRDE